MVELQQNLKMIRTKFQTESFDELFELYDEFESKLTMWSEKNIDATWDIQILIGDHEYIIIVTVTDDADEKTK